VEAALAVASLVAVLVLCLAGLTAVATHVRCVDAAREAARLAARGDDATGVLDRAGTAGARLEVRTEADRVVARVTSTSPLLPGIVISAEAVAAVEYR
jgi:membrane peptidoglycan carboxypeptidase